MPILCLDYLSSTWLRAKHSSCRLEMLSIFQCIFNIQYWSFSRSLFQSIDRSLSISCCVAISGCGMFRAINTICLHQATKLILLEEYLCRVVWKLALEHRQFYHRLKLKLIYVFVSFIFFFSFILFFSIFVHRHLFNCTIQNRFKLNKQDDEKYTLNFPTEFEWYWSEWFSFLPSSLFGGRARARECVFVCQCI